MAAGLWTTDDIYINNRNYPGGPWAYFLATQNLPENVTFIVALFIMTFLSDLLVVSKFESFSSVQFFDLVDLALAVLGCLEFWTGCHRICHSSFPFAYTPLVLRYESQFLMPENELTRLLQHWGHCGVCNRLTPVSPCIAGYLSHSAHPTT